MSGTRSRRARTFWVGAALGIACMAIGARGLLDHASATRPGAAITWLVGADLVHDLLIAPVACFVGLALARGLPRPWRGPVRAGLFATAIVLAVGWAPLRGYGRMTAPDNPSVQPLDYASAVGTVLVTTWILVALWLVALTWSRRAAAGSDVPG